MKKPGQDMRQYIRALLEGDYDHIQVADFGEEVNGKVDSALEALDYFNGYLEDLKNIAHSVEGEYTDIAQKILTTVDSIQSRTAEFYPQRLNQIRNSLSKDYKRGIHGLSD